MPEITAITLQQHDKTRCNIEVDGRFFCGMKAETVYSNRLSVGLEVTLEELSRMQYESERQSALDRALSHISASMKTEREVREFLAKKGYLPEASDYAVSRMKELGFIDDAAYALAYAKSAGEKKGPRAVAAALRMKGISDEAIEAALNILSDGAETAKRVLEKYMRGKPKDNLTLRKAATYLVSRGFDYDTARAAVSDLKGEADED